MKNERTQHSSNTEAAKLPAYLKQALQGVRQAFEQKEPISFSIIEAKEKGYSVKVNGLFAFVSFGHFAWSYPSIKFWHNASSHLVGYSFSGSIHSLKENPVGILIDAKSSSFEPAPLALNSSYRAVVLQKSKSGVFADLGVHFNWQYGSLLGLIHQSNVLDKNQWEAMQEGEIISIQFMGYNEEQQLILGDHLERAKWLNGEMAKLTGSIQEVQVSKPKQRRPTYSVLGKYPGKISMNSEFYPQAKTAVKKYLNQLQDDDCIACEVVGINKKRDGFLLKLCKQYWEAKN